MPFRRCWQQASTNARCISSSQLTIERQTDTTAFDSRPAKEDLVFGTTLSDHMIMAEWSEETQWSAPRIVPYQDLKICPASSCLHYGECEYWICDEENSMFWHDFNCSSTVLLSNLVSVSFFLFFFLLEYPPPRILPIQHKLFWNMLHPTTRFNQIEINPHLSIHCQSFAIHRPAML